jgi:hypothetical protein
MATIPTATALWSLPDQMQMQSSAMTESRWSQVDKPEYGGGSWQVNFPPPPPPCNTGTRMVPSANQRSGGAPWVQVVGDDSQMVYVILQPGEVPPPHHPSAGCIGVPSPATH